MIRAIVILMVLCLGCSIFAGGSGMAAEVLTRAGLQAAVDSYLKAATNGDISELPLATEAKNVLKIR